VEVVFLSIDNVKGMSIMVRHCGYSELIGFEYRVGNGTQRAFNDDPTVLYISLHRYEQGTFYPCGPFGGLQSCGEGPGLG